MKIRKITDTRPKILLIQGSPRSVDSCSNQESKSSKLVSLIMDKWLPFVNFEVIDLSQDGKPKIQPCKGCISTSGGMHCHWKCSCFSKNMKDPDLMYEYDIYDKFEQCDGFLVVTPIHWYSVTSQVKAMFDRLVCSNQTLTKDQAIEIFGKGNIKNSGLTSKAELSEKYKSLLKNHLEGKIASFFAYGDNGGNDYDNNPPYKGDKDWDIKNSIMPLVHQCRYSGMICPDDLVKAIYSDQDKSYSESNFVLSNDLVEGLNFLVEKIINKYATLKKI